MHEKNETEAQAIKAEIIEQTLFFIETPVQGWHLRSALLFCRMNYLDAANVFRRLLSRIAMAQIIRISTNESELITGLTPNLISE